MLMPVEVFCDWGYAIHLTLASAAFAAFLRLRGVGLPSAIFGSMAAFWVGNNLTLVFPGHLYKYGVLTAAALFLWLWEKALASGHPSGSLWPAGRSA
ncbi:MAG: hypothetical protein U1F87_06585 [Kiritimatiellia bacterium]